MVAREAAVAACEQELASLAAGHEELARTLAEHEVLIAQREDAQARATEEMEQARKALAEQTAAIQQRESAIIEQEHDLRRWELDLKCRVSDVCRREAAATTRDQAHIERCRQDKADFDAEVTGRRNVLGVHEKAARKWLEALEARERAVEEAEARAAASVIAAASAPTTAAGSDPVLDTQLQMAMVRIHKLETGLNSVQCRGTWR
ncbi:hypothetical protein E2562_036959 [Oryza meyeriana var. granulata]|uniref:Uncharacterized protein n=1 Tax=Oryza meyeriana var. granulata TaxID=110450 RepID=A0A6G1ETH4_9ORYZ|nr:hypothetical protein E2562_036959 [Oryza meyeriana var. granulata]